jgi:hypothetical protein
MPHVIGDVLLKQVALDEADLRAAVINRGRVEFSNFFDLVPGDYVYQNAVLGFRFFAPVGQGRPAVSDLELTIDVQDVSEQIIGTVTNDWTPFTFAKKFNVPPEVVVYQRTGTTLAVGRARNITTTGFEAALIDGSGFTAGEIAAIASGY